MSVIDVLLGRPLANREEEEQKVGVAAGVPMLGLDGLASSAYGPEAALTVLIPLGAAGLAYGMPLIGVILLILGILFVSYRQTMAAYPNGGGSYTVASENLGRGPGLLAAAALLLDYVLVVAVGISAGAAAFVSAFPAFQPYLVHLCLGTLVLITVVNLRGVKESGLAFMVPTYLFVVAMAYVLVVGLFRTLTSGGTPAPLDPPAALPAATATVSLGLLMHAFASGCTAMTGVEAVSNGMNAFAQPRVKNAQRTLAVIVAILATLLLGIAFLARAYRVGATEPGAAGYESIVSQLTAAILGRGPLYFVTMAGVLAVLALSANTGFADFPRLCRLLAEDDYLPHAFANRGRRLVYSRGIVILAVMSAGLLIAFGGVTDRLIPLFAVGAFLAFTLSQAGMVIHWRRVGGRPGALLINLIGAVATGIALLVVLLSKLSEGAWITLLLIPVMLLLFRGVRGHYAHVASETSGATSIAVDDLLPPIVVVPVKGWDTITQKALQFALKLSPDVHAVHIATEGDDLTQLYEAWRCQVDAPLQAAGRPTPELFVISSPFRRLFHPLLKHLQGLMNDHSDRQIAVIVPELVEAKWWQYLLHNQRATGLKASLLLNGGRRVVVINVPWYLDVDCK